MKEFRFSFVIAVIGLLLAGLWGGPVGAVTALILSVLEVSLSFDNAVLNASVLKEMSPKWQGRFLTWGIFIAVFLMRLVFPVVIVALVAHLGVFEVVRIALNDPTSYARHLSEAHISIASFGGMFLLMVFLTFLLDPEKEAHWLAPLEKRLAPLGRINGLSVILALATLVGIQQLVPPPEQVQSLVAGIVGVVSYILIHGLCSMLEGGDLLAKGVKQAGFMSFLYLEVLDASFSLDGVIGAFAITQDVVIIMLGLGIGAFFVRSITIFLTRKGTLLKYLYLEHGAHYAIGVLACIMLASARFEIPEVFTGTIGALLIVASLGSSILHNRKQLGTETVETLD